MELSIKDKQRFDKKINKTESCWTWTDKPGKNGYGKFCLNYKTYLAHRVSFLIANGNIPKHDFKGSTSICHTCDNKLCVNPAHLFVGSYADNNRDCKTKGRKARMFGSKNPNSKLSEYQVTLIKLMFKLGAKKSVIVNMFNSVHKTHIYGILANKYRNKTI